MTPTVFIIDTSYLLELFEVHEVSSRRAVDEIRKRYTSAVKESCRFYVPFPCICELGNRIAQIKNGNNRRELAQKLRDTVKSCIEEDFPWIITLFDKGCLVDPMCNNYADKYVQRGIGLTDTIVVQEAYRLKHIYSGLGYKVHIWTKDANIKALEPEKEVDAFVI